MSRRALSVIVGIFGFVVAGASLALLTIGGSLMADARTANITGPGVDVFVRTPFARIGEEVVIDVEARGGSRAGIDSVEVRSDGQVIAHETGHGADWGYSITDGHDRGSETVTLHVQPVRSADGRLPLDIRVEYVVAMSSGDGSTFTNDVHTDTVSLDIPLYDATGRRVAQATSLAIAAGTFLLWFGLVWGIARLFHRASVRDPHASAKDGESMGISLVMGCVGGGIAGYWLFAFRVMNVLATQSSLIAVLLVGAWFVAPVWWSVRWTRHQRAASKLPRAELRR